MRKLTKMLSVLVVVAMAICMLVPVVASADTYVAEVGGAQYSSLQAAIDAAQEGETVSLLADTTLAAQTISGESAKYGAYITKNLTINGNGFVITSNAERAIGVKGVESKVDVVFKDVVINNSNKGAICICTRGGIGSLTLDQVDLNTQGCPSGYNQPLTIGGSQLDKADVTIKDSIIRTNDEASKYYAIILWNPVNLTITDTTIKGWACVYQKPFEEGTVDETVVSIDNSTLVSNGIKGSSNHFAAIMTEEAGFNCEVTNTDINVTAAEGTYQGIAAGKYGIHGFDIDLGEGNHVILTGDTALIGYNFDDEADEISVSGGTFNVPVDTYYCADGFIPEDNGDGAYGVDGPYAARVGDTVYSTLAAAIAAANAQENATVLLLSDYDMEANEPGYGWTTSYVAAGETTPRDNMIELSGTGLTFDLGGHTLSNLYNNTFKVTGKDVTVQNGTMTIGTLYAGSYSKGKVTAYATPRPCSYVIFTDGAENFTINDLTTTGGINVSASSVTVNGLNFSGASYYAICSQDSSDVTINGGTFDKATAGYANYLVWVDGDTPSVMTINGGTFLKGTAKFLPANDGVPVIKGGTFDFDPSAYVAAGYQAVDNGDGTYTVTNIDLITGYSIATEAYVDLSFYIDSTAVTPEIVSTSDAVVTFDWENGTASTDLEASDLTENGFKATLPNLPAAEMTMGVTATISVDGEVVGVSDPYSVRDYAMQIINNPESETALKNLAENMLVYGAAAQEVFKVKENDLANEYIDLDLADIDSNDIDDAIASANGGQTSSDLNDVANQLGGNYYTSSLIFLAGNTLRHYFTGSLNAEDFDGAKADYYYYVEKTNIAADKLDELQEFNVGGVTFYYSALDYVKNVMANSAEGSDAYNLAVATFMYNQAANAYFGN